MVRLHSSPGTWEPSLSSQSLREPLTGSPRPCLGCGVVVMEPDSKHGARCESCTEEWKAARPRRGERKSKASSWALGYDSKWRRLSKRARQLQPWCSDCHSTEDLTADHLRWPALSLADIDVVCRSCNSKRGAIRGPGGAPLNRGVREPQGGARVLGTSDVQGGNE